MDNGYATGLIMPCPRGFPFSFPNGMEASGDGPLNPEEWRNWLEWMQRHSISWVAWSVSDKDETCSMLYPTASSEGSWEERDLKEWGHMVRDELKK